jgi:ATP-dependent helicase/DNAse subunit B
LRGWAAALGSTPAPLSSKPTGVGAVRKYWRVPIALITGPANAGKARVVMEALRGHLAGGEEPLLVVPTRADSEHYLHELAGEGAAMGARVERFAGLIEEAVRRAGVRAPTLDGLARERVIAAIAGGKGGQRVRSGFVSALAAVIAELQVRRVTPDRLDAALLEWSAADGEGVVSENLGRLFADYRGALQRIGRLDQEQHAVCALDALRRKPALWGATPVLFYGFDDLTPLQLDTIETLGKVVGARVMVSLTFQAGRSAFAGRAATFAGLAPIADEHRELPVRGEYYAPHARTALGHLERSLFEPDAERVDPSGAVRLLEGGGERAELELVAGEIVRLLDAGMAPEEIAIVARAPGAVADLLEEVLARARVPYALQRRRPFADTAIGWALMGLLRCACGGGELGDLLAWLRAPGVLERTELADALELRARRTGITSAQGARALWEQRNWPLDTIDYLREAAERSVLALIERATRELQRLFDAPMRGQARVLDAEEIDEASALAAGRRALAELRELVRLSPELAPADPGELARALEGVEILSGERPTPGAVAVLDPLALRARRVRALFVCGLQEGVFPARARPQPFLAEEERRRLAETSGLRLGEPQDALAAERYLFYAAVSRPEEVLYLSWHVADDDGEPASRSLFVDDVCDLFTDELVEGRLRRPLGAAELEPLSDASQPAPASVSEPASATAFAPAAAPVAALERTLRDPRLLEDLREQVWSASSLQVWIGCPVRWFVERTLRPGSFDPDAEPLARGGLAHAALKDTLDGLRRETGSARLTLGNVARARELLAEALCSNEPDYPLSVAPERRPGVRRRLRADLERYLLHAAEAESQLEPSRLELGFGFEPDDDRGEQGDLPAFDLGGGVRMRGRIDRVDVDDGGAAVVYDYKSSLAPAPAKWIGERNLQVALYMRAVEDLLGVRAVGGFYQPLSGADLRARGVLEADSGVQLDCVRGDVREPEDVRELLDEALGQARTAAAEAARGALEPRPQTCAFHGGCMYPTICRCER